MMLNTTQININKIKSMNEISIKNNPIDVVLANFNLMIGYNNYFDMNIRLVPDLEENEKIHGDFTLHPAIGCMIRISANNNIYFTAIILAHELAHALDFYFASGQQQQNTIDRNPHNMNWKRHYDKLCESIKDIFGIQHIKFEIKLSEELRINNNL